MLATSDGLFLTGELPPHLDQSTISVFAPQLFKKVGRYARELSRLDSTIHDFHDNQPNQHLPRGRCVPDCGFTMRSIQQSTTASL